jgi:hypothetical protein
MAGYEVETNTEPAPMCLSTKPGEIVVCPIPGGDFVKIGDIVPGIAKRGFKNRIQPNRVTTD